MSTATTIETYEQVVAAAEAAVRGLAPLLAEMVALEAKEREGVCYRFWDLFYDARGVRATIAVLRTKEDPHAGKRAWYGALYAAPELASGTSHTAGTGWPGEVRRESTGGQRVFRLLE
jgi:hypothetical protein